MTRGNIRRWLLSIAAAALVAAAGAGCSGPVNAPVDAQAARETLTAALDSWKRGEEVDALQKASPPIFVIDEEWRGGAILKDYRLLGDGEEKDANLYCQVVLTIRTRGGADVTKEVIYIISTAPNRTVSRKVF
jgi:hypothetical protein